VGLLGVQVRVEENWKYTYDGLAKVDGVVHVRVVVVVWTNGTSGISDCVGPTHEGAHRRAVPALKGVWLFFPEMVDCWWSAVVGHRGLLSLRRRQGLNCSAG